MHKLIVSTNFIHYYMMTNKEELKRQFLLKKLEDPTVGEWEKRNIRKELGIFTKLTEQDFDRPKDEKYLYFFYYYIEQNIFRLNKKNNTNTTFSKLSDYIKSIYYLYSFSSTFESDGFWDYSEVSLKQYEQESDDNLREEKIGLLKGLKDLGLTEDATFLEQVWNKEEISDDEIDQIQERFWHIDYKKDFSDRIANFIIKNKVEFLELQDL